MEARAVDLQVLLASNRWRAAFHVLSESTLRASHGRLRRLSECVIESKRATNPQEMEGAFYYFGLENVEPVTGHAVGVELKDGSAVKSRSKLFVEGDILYGRLRPYLRKAYLAGTPYSQGLCSTEFIVVKPKDGVILGEFLRELLVTMPVTEQLVRRQGGAALPRVASCDLLGLQVPIPPIEVQLEYVARILEVGERRQQLQRELATLDAEREKLLDGIFK